MLRCTVWGMPYVLRCSGEGRPTLKTIALHERRRDSDKFVSLYVEQSRLVHDCHRD